MLNPYFSDFFVKMCFFILVGLRKSIYICSTFTGQGLSRKS